MATVLAEETVKKNLLTAEGLASLEQELEHLRLVKRKEISQKIKEAREQGDLSENAEYDAARDEQRETEARIEEIENILKHAEVIDESGVDTKTVGIGCKVKVRDLTFEEDLVFAIVGSTEASSRDGKISNESPVGQALMGAKRNQIVTVDMPNGEMRFKVLKIEKNVPKKK